MNKKTKRNIIIAIVLLFVAFYFYLSQKQGTISKELKDFAIEDTSSVNKILMVNKENNQVLLERKNDIWMVNEKYIARKDAVNVLLKTLNRIDVKAPVARSMFETVVGKLAVKSIKVEIYQNNKLTKTYYVGGPTTDQYGTYMLLENSTQPFVMHIKGFRGYLTPRYFIDENQWRDRILFNYHFNQISSIIVEQPLKPDQSFRLLNMGDNKFELESLKNRNKIISFDTIKVKQYIASFKKIYFDSFVKYIDQEKKDSILSTSPHYRIIVEDINGDLKSITTYYKPNDGLLNDEGKLLRYDPDYEYAMIENDQEMVLIQYFVFYPIFRKLNYFVPKFTK